jgi:hypothetical protein
LIKINTDTSFPNHASVIVGANEIAKNKTGIDYFETKDKKEKEK